MYEFRYGYVKEKYSENVELCFVDTDSFIVHIETVDIYKDLPKNVEIIFDTLNYELDRLIHKKWKTNWINERWIRQKNQEFVGLRAKTDRLLIDDSSKDKKAKMCVKRKLNFEDYKGCLEENQLESKINHL